MRTGHHLYPRRWLRFVAVLPIRVYQRLLSPLIAPR